MFLRVRLIQVFLFPAEAEETVGQLHARLQRHIEELLRKQHAAAPPPQRTIPALLGAICCPLAQPRDGLDLHLVFRGEALLDPRAKLSEVGLCEGSELTVLSQALAERHGASQGVTCLNDAFRELATGPEGGARAEELALLNSKPFPLCCGHMALGELGAGWPLFFELVAFLSLLALALVLVHLPALFLYGLSPREALASWPVARENGTVIEFGYLTAGNLGPSGSGSCIPGISAALAALAIVLSSRAMMFRQQRLKNDVDAAEVDPNDYALFLQGLPQDAVDEAEVQSFLEAKARNSGERTEVVSVVLGYDSAEFVSLLQQVAGAKSAAAKAEDEEERAGFEREAAELRKPLETEATLRAHLPLTGSAVAVLRHEADQKSCLAEWDTWREATAWQLPRHLQHRLSGQPQFRGTDMLRVSRAANPSDLIWENLGFSQWERFKARVRTYLSLSLIFVLCVGIVVGLERLKQRLNLGSWFALIVVLPLVLSAKICGPAAVRRYVTQQRHMTKTQRDLSLTWKYTLFAVLIYLAVPVLIVGDPSGGQGHPGYYSSGNGLFDTVLVLLTVHGFVLPLFTLCGTGNLMRRAVLSWNIPGLPRSGIDLDEPPAGLTQQKYRTMFEPPEVNFPRVMAQVLKTFLLGVFFLPMFPLGLILTAGGLLTEYWAFKYQLLRLSKRPYRQSHEVAFGSLRLVLLAAAALSVMQYYLLEPSLVPGSAGQRLCLWLFYLGPITALVLLAPWPTGTLPACDPVSSHREIDYYSAQRAWPKHCKYHATNPVYQWIEKVAWTAVRQGKPGAVPTPWDPRTGNFPDPAAGCAEETVPEVAPRPGSLDPGSEDGVPPGFELAAPSAPPIEELEEHASWSTDAPEETGTISEVGPGVLALEEAKYRMPLAMLGEEESSSDEGETLTSSSSEDESEATAREDSELSLAAVGENLGDGCVAEINGLVSSRAARYNGTVCTLRMLDLETGRWLVQLEDGEKARLPAGRLRPVVVLRAGQRARIHGMVRAEQYNGTVCSLISWSVDLVKWKVRLFTGARATVAAANLEPLVDG